MHNQFSMSFKSRSRNLQQYCDITEYWWCAGFSHNWFTCKSLERGPCNSTEFFVFVCMFFFCQNFSAIISNKIKFLTHISLIGKSRLGFLPNGNLPLHGFQYNSSKLYKIFFQSLCWLKNLGKKSRFCNTVVKLTYIFAPWITGQLVNCPRYTLTCWQLSLDGSILSSKSPFPK